jgi:hypothetical protein
VIENCNQRRPPGIRRQGGPGVTRYKDESKGYAQAESRQVRLEDGSLDPFRQVIPDYRQHMCIVVQAKNLVASLGEGG